MKNILLNRRFTPFFDNKETKNFERYSMKIYIQNK